MEAKKFLHQAFYFYRRLLGRSESIIRLQELTRRVTTIVNGVPSGKPCDNSAMEQATLKVQEQIELMAEDIKYFLSALDKISRAINEVADEDERAVLEYRYLAFQTWKHVSVSMGLSLQHVYRLHNKALEKINHLNEKNFSAEQNETKGEFDK